MAYNYNYQPLSYNYGMAPSNYGMSQQPNFGMAPPVQNQPAQGLSPSSRMVSNRDEANSVPADFTGSLMVFPDIRNNRVYIKKWNYQTGTADFLEFVPATQEQTPQYATAEDLNALRRELAELKGATTE